MEEEHKVFIRGVNGRGNELIETLVELGAKDKGFCDYNREEFIYFINHYGYIDSINPNCEFGKIIIDNYREIKLPELWKDEDILVDNDDPNRFVVKNNVWNDGNFKAYLYVALKYIQESPIATFRDKNYHKADSKEVRRFHKILHNHGKDWDTEKKQLVTWKWKPKEKEIYWCIWPDGHIGSGVFNNDEFDNNSYNFGNCFPTREEAEAMLNKIKKLLNAKS